MHAFHSTSLGGLVSGRLRLLPLVLSSTLFCSLCGSPRLLRAQTTSTANIEVSLDSLEPIHLAAAQEYSIYADENRKKKLTLRQTPITQWVNQRRSGGQLGHVFVWMNGETPAAMAAIFSFPWRGVATDRRVVHELHALAPSRLQVRRNNQPSRWQPKSGLARKPIPGVAGGSNSLARFRIRLRQIARRFSGHCIATNNQRWELRLLPTPLLVYPISESQDVQGFGAIIGMMGDTGSDLESGLVIEAISSKSSTGNVAAQWSFAPIRMTDMETHLLLDKQPVWKSVRTADDTSYHDAQHVYFRFQDKTVPLQTGT